MMLCHRVIDKFSNLLMVDMYVLLVFRIVMSGCLGALFLFRREHVNAMVAILSGSLLPDGE